MLKRRRESRRPPRFKGQTINKMIPNIITMSALCAGLTGIRFAINEQWELAVAAILIAAVLDALDGRMARLLKSSSDFGAELDSLSDVIAFGVAPALVVYFWSLSEANGMGWAAALFFAVCCALRLARFNSSLGKLPPYAYNYFTGVPAPAAAGLALLPVVIGFELRPGILDHPMIGGIWLVLVGLMMVSRIPTYSFKRLKVPQPYVLPMLVAVGLLAGSLAGYPWRTLAFCGIAYMASFPFSVRSYRRLRAEAERLHAVEEEEGDAAASKSANGAGEQEKGRLPLRPI